MAYIKARRQTGENYPIGIVKDLGNRTINMSYDVSSLPFEVTPDNFLVLPSLNSGAGNANTAVGKAYNTVYATLLMNIKPTKASNKIFFYDSAIGSYYMTNKAIAQKGSSTTDTVAVACITGVTNVRAYLIVPGIEALKNGESYTGDIPDGFSKIAYIGAAGAGALDYSYLRNSSRVTLDDVIIGSTSVYFDTSGIRTQVSSTGNYALKAHLDSNYVIAPQKSINTSAKTVTGTKGRIRANASIKLPNMASYSVASQTTLKYIDADVFIKIPD